ncbi:MAG: ATP-binding protein [Desulfobacterales bacterium]|jgi:PAS domain S-box-containing protein
MTIEDRPRPIKQEILLIGASSPPGKQLAADLRRAGFGVRGAENRDGALAAVADFQPAKILIDSRGDAVDAPDVIRRLQEEGGVGAEIVAIAAGKTAIACYQSGAAAVFESVDGKSAVAALAARLGRPPADSTAKRPVTEERPVQEILEDERFITVNQVLDNISLIIEQISDEVEGGVKYFTQMPYFVSVHDRQQNVLITNAAYRKLLGNKIGRKSWEIYRAPWANPDDCPVGKTLQTEQVQETRAVVKYRSGLRVPVIVHTAPIYNNEGAVELVLEVSAGTRDVRRLSKQLRQTQQRYEQLFNAVPCYIAVLNRDLRITAVNRPFKEEFGDHTGERFFSVFHNTAGGGADPISRTLDDADPHEAEMALQHAEGKRANVLVWTSPMTTAAGKLLQILVMFVDITQIRKLRDNLSSLGLMMGTIAHGIKGVLTGLSGGIYLISSGHRQQQPHKVEEGIVIARQMIQRMERVVFDILYYTKKRTLKVERIEAEGFAADIAGVFTPKLEGTDIEFVTRFDAPGVLLEADTTMLRSALVNILENAADACSEDASPKNHRIVFRMEAREDQVVFEVQDNGPGMDAEAKKKLFDLFYSTKGNKGTGLGMFITDKIIRQHGGIIELESTPGRGTLFSVSLPMEIPEVLKQYRTDKILDVEL